MQKLCNIMRKHAKKGALMATTIMYLVDKCARDKQRSLDRICAIKQG